MSQGKNHDEPIAAYKQDVTPQDREPGEVDLSSFHDCPICGKMFFAFIDLYDHIARHRKESAS